MFYRIRYSLVKHIEMNNTIEAAQPTVARSAAKNILGVGRRSVEKIAISAARSQPFSLFRGPRVEIQLGPALVRASCRRATVCPENSRGLGKFGVGLGKFGVGLGKFGVDRRTQLVSRAGRAHIRCGR